MEKDALGLYPEKGLHTRCRVVRVVDGDTIEVIFRWRGATYVAPVRLARIDTAESQSRGGHVVTPTEKEWSRRATTHMQELCKDGRGTMTVLKSEKYGRLLGEVWVGDVNLSDAMLTSGLAVEYGGNEKAYDWNRHLC